MALGINLTFVIQIAYKILYYCIIINDNQKEWILVVEMTIQSGIVKGTVITLKLSKINFKFKQKKYDQIAFKSTKFHFIFL